MSLKARVLRGAVWSLIQGWGTQFGSLAIFFLLARLLDPEAFGLVALASVFLAFMQVFLSQGFADALVQREVLEPEHLDAAFWTSVFLGTGLMILGLASSDVVAGFFKTPELSPVLRWFSVILLIESLSSVHQAQLQRQFAFKALAARHLLGIISGGIVGAVMALNQAGVWALVGQQFVQELVATTVLWVSVPWKPQGRFSFRHWQELLNFGLNQLAFGLLAFCNNRADDFLIGYYLGPTSLGYYSLAYRILTAMTNLLVNSTNQVALPTFSRLQNDLSRFRDVFYQATQFSSALAFPIFVSVSVLSPELISLLFGAKWLPAVPVLQVLAFVGALRSVTYFKSSIFLALGKPVWRLRLGVLSSTLNVVGFFIAVRWGIVAVAAAYLARACIVFPISQGAVSRLIKTPLLEYLRQFVPTLSSALAMGLSMFTIRNFMGSYLDEIGIILVSSAVGTAVYCGMVYYLRPELLKQLWGILTLARKRLQPQSD